MAQPDQLQAVPAPVLEAAARDNLGGFRGHWHGRFRASVTATIALAIVFGLVLPACMISDGLESGYVFVAVGLVLCAATGWLAGWEHRHSGDDVYLFGAGIVHLDRRGTVTAFPFWAIAEVRYRVRKAQADIPGNPLPVGSIKVRTVHHLTALRTDGARLMLNNRFRKVAALIHDLHVGFVAARLTDLLATLRAGQTISFDGVVVDHQGIRMPRGVVPWSEITSIDAVEALFGTSVTVRTGRFRPHRRRLRPARPLANYVLLLALHHVLGRSA